jgi:hypothetical protein
MKTLSILSIALAATISAPAMAATLPALVPMPAQITPEHGTLTIAKGQSSPCPPGMQAHRPPRSC